EVRPQSRSDCAPVKVIKIAVQPVLSGPQLVIDPYRELIRPRIRCRKVPGGADVGYPVRCRTELVCTRSWTSDVTDVRCRVGNWWKFTHDVSSDRICPVLQNPIAQFGCFNRCCGTANPRLQNSFISGVEERPVVHYRSADPVAKLISPVHGNIRVEEIMRLH